MTQKNTTSLISPSKSPRHGHVFSPESRAYFAWQDGKIDPGALNQAEAGKFFPATSSGMRDPVAPTDQPNNKPPVDGKIASGGQGPLSFLDEPGSQWRKHDVKAGDMLTVSWDYSARHATRRWNYFITRSDWDPSKPLSRAQFEEQPFYKVELSLEPYWEYGDELMSPKPTVHEFQLPNRTGYHVLLAVWEVANTGNAFYQVIDLNFVGDGGTGGGGNGGGDGGTGGGGNGGGDGGTGGGGNGGGDGGTGGGGNGGGDGGTGGGGNGGGDGGTGGGGNGGGDGGTGGGGGTPVEPPSSPMDLRVVALDDDYVTLSWKPSSAGSLPLVRHKVYRNNGVLVAIEAGENVYTDRSVIESRKYTYYVTGVDLKGNESLPSDTVTVVPKDDDDRARATQQPPTAPLDLYSTNVTDDSVTLRWGASSSSGKIVNYLVYRDGVELGQTSQWQLSYTDSGLSPERRYRYFVAAKDSRGQLSVPGNVLAVTTEKENTGGGNGGGGNGGGGGEPAVPEWTLYTRYEVGDKVSYKGKVYSCYQAHTTLPGWEPDVTVNVLWLLVQ